MENQIIMKFKEVFKEYIDDVGYRILLFENISFELSKGMITSIIAPTGAGKSSLLQIAAKLQKPTKGVVETEDGTKIVFIPGSPSSFPWLNLKGNLRIAQPSIEEEEIFKISKMVGLEGYEDHLPDNHSLGFRFRISLARAISVKADLIILDEPFNEMHAVTRNEIYSLLRQLGEKENLTFLLGTTNISEAIFLSDKIFLMRKDPGSIIEFYNNQLPAGRSAEIFNSDQFVKFRTEIEERFQKEKLGNLQNFSI